MSLTRDQQIRVNALLLEREERFVRVHEVEQAINAVLGAPYPFTRPALPSDVRTKPKPAARRAGAGPGSAVGGVRERLRRLEERETRYRVTYRRGGQTVQEEHTETDALRTLIAGQGAQLRVLRIETLDTAGRVIAVVYSAGSDAPETKAE